ncbi:MULTISPECIES: hypothetical protein [unclassified Microbacterium]|uniref:hypothetical protein n=1 Tax=unclassified Microbacterium TaxID=2609290 RepID=UPI00214B4296|nr:MULTISPECIES: hypothetical protein [unclassified Microbacterium]MCR2811007.1 hypothetical protein [Microbacterium sp. zg.B185]WIM19595.1 hypothetical protein QNO12_01965 [Microbacterium sp. zg-B185]
MVELTGALPSAVVVPVDAEGWAHFTEGPADIAAAAVAAGAEDRVVILSPGIRTMIEHGPR